MSDYDEQLPPPDVLLQMAEEEPLRFEMSDYIEAIRHLKDEKNFSFRQIADWMSRKGLKCDHNAIYREYTKLPEQIDLEKEQRELEQEIE